MPDYEENTHAGPSDHEWVTAQENTHAGPSDHEWVTTQENTHAGPSDHEWVTTQEITHAGPSDHKWVTTQENTHAWESDHQWVTTRENTHAWQSDHQWVTTRERTSMDPGARRSRTNNRTDVLTTFHYYIQIDGISEGVFNELSGFEAETEVLHQREGGLNTHEHQLLGPSKISEITLKNGITGSTELWEWYKRVLQGPPWGSSPRKNIDIIMVDQEGTPKHIWHILEAIPVKWTGPQLNAGQSQTAVQTLKFAHRGLQLETSY